MSDSITERIVGLETRSRALKRATIGLSILAAGALILAVATIIMCTRDGALPMGIIGAGIGIISLGITVLTYVDKGRFARLVQALLEALTGSTIEPSAVVLFKLWLSRLPVVQGLTMSRRA